MNRLKLGIIMLTQVQLNSLARKIIESNEYMTLATSSKKSAAWASPVAYTFDKDWNFYYVSIPLAKHSQNIEENSQVCVAIFDSHQNEGEGVGLQIEGKIYKMSIKDSFKIIPIYSYRKFPYIRRGKDMLKSIKKFVQKFIVKQELYRFYKFVPERIWINNPNASIDERVVVEL